MADQTQRDIINRKISAETLRREQQIQTRLLEAEKAENEREQEKKRESNEGNIDLRSNPKDIFKNRENNSSFSENLNMSNIKLFNFYKKKYKEYLIKLNEGQK